MMHDFGITENYALFMDLPVIFDLNLAIQGVMPFRWSDEYPARVGVMPRTGTDADVQWFDVEPCYVFHTTNAFEKDVQIHFDVCRSSEVWREPGNMLSAGAVQTMHRWSFDLASGSTSETTLDERGMDFPKIADRRVGIEHRYGFTLEFGFGMENEPVFQNLLKLDLHKGTTEEHRFPDGYNVSEPCFVPATGSDAASDEGWVMLYAHDNGSNQTEFVTIPSHPDELLLHAMGVCSMGVSPPLAARAPSGRCVQRAPPSSSRSRRRAKSSPDPTQPNGAVRTAMLSCPARPATRWVSISANFGVDAIFTRVWGVGYSTSPTTSQSSSTSPRSRLSTSPPKRKRPPSASTSLRISVA
jgi:hypothetical protein